MSAIALAPDMLFITRTPSMRPQGVNRMVRIFLKKCSPKGKFDRAIWRTVL